jgi:hypothetical protein
MFIPLGEGRFTATDNTGGPWDAQVQHGGPPSALLARALEALPGLGGPVTRVSVDLLGPVPLGDVSVTARVERPGRSVELLVAELAAGGRTAARATGWRIRTQELDLPPGPDRGPTGAPALPDEDSPSPQWPGGFLRAMQWRVVEGDWSELGPATVWGRMRVPLVSGEQPSRLCRVMVLADCGNGASAALPHADWVFINPDLTVHLARVPRGEWLCLEARTALDPSGFGLARSRIYDAAGLVAAGEQTLYVGRR